MILSDEELNIRLASPDNIINLVEHKDNIDPRMSGSVQVIPANQNGQGDRGPAVPDLIRQLIANVAINSDEGLAETANVFSVGVPSVSNYSRGLVHNRLDEELKDLADKTAEQKTDTAHNAALDNLVATLGLVGSKLETITTAKEATQIAVSMSNVVKNLKSKDEEGPKVKTLVVITMPSLKKESQFQTIDV